MSEVERPKYGISKNFSFPLDKSNRFGGHHKTELSIPEIDPNFPLDQQLDDVFVKHVQESSNYLNKELDRQIEEVLDEAE
tara:strand:+ start:1683 stop:1922 length:240 start_codon:yes stop_codon:yes gene_type:complete